MNESEMRLDPLRQTWTVFSPDRALQPQLSARKPAEAPAPLSPFVSGQEKFLGQVIHEKALEPDWRVRVVPNRAPILRVEGDPRRRADGFYDRSAAVGAHEVIIETADQTTLEELDLPKIGSVIEAWKLRMVDLLGDKRMRSFFVLKDVGVPAGERVSHSLSQLVAMAIVPPHLRAKLKVARGFYADKGRSIFEDILTEELRANGARLGSRMVYENNGFALFCPYASRSPFEQMILPKRQCADFHGISDQEISQLADVLKTGLMKLHRALNQPAYNLMLTTAPTRTVRRDQWNTIDQDFRWHIEIVPRLYHLGGFELATGCHVNTVLPEVAADYLRKIDI
jgi:UDPglucose--hexose-1-phosphate uridylyltransferase